MQTVSESLTLLWEALFLQPEPYATMRDQKNPAGKGVVILIILGLVLALAAFIGSLLTWASSPDLAAVKDTVFKYLQQMSWWDMMAMNPQAEAIWFQIWDSIWQFIQVMTPSPASGLAGFIFTPLNLIISWIIFGLVAHVMAKIFGGQGGLGQTLGATSLAAAPQLLALFNIFPFVVLAGVSVWTLLARYLAIRVTHDLSWGRAVWVTVLTLVVIYLVLFFLFGVGIFAFSTAMAASFGGG
jgi:hypothetical protein